MPAVKVGLIVLALYLFVVGVGGMGHAFKLFGVELAEQLMAATSHPFKALCIGILATTLVQSSSTSTSIIVGMVAGGVLTGQAAVFMIMGANIGTSITSMLVSFGHIHRKQELERAFSVASVHYVFNFSAVALLFPLELFTGILTRTASASADIFQNFGGMKLSNPLKAITEPVIQGLEYLCASNGWILLLVTVVLTFSMLILIVKLLRSLVLHRVEVFFDTHLFRNSGRAMLFGLLLTFAVQTSSVPTALVVPLAGAGILRLAQIYPYCLGSNLGTTMTAMLAALATGSDVAVKAAFAHLLFNVFGILLIWPVRLIRNIPMRISEWMGRSAANNRFFPLIFVAVMFFLLPALFTIFLK